MPRILPELEAYQVRLEERARSWDEMDDDDLAADLARCEEQIRLLEKGIAEFSSAVEAMPESLASQRDRARHRLSVLSQTRDLTGAYAHVLRGYRQRRAKA